MPETQKFDLAELLKGVSDLDTREQIVRLPLGLLDKDPENFYSLDGIEELAGNIETVGLLDPIRVRPEGERYVVVSGHRRRAACLLIRDGGSEQFKAGVPCIVEYGEASDAMRKLRLIYANSSTRQLTSAELSRQAEEVTRLLYELKEQGVEFPGRMRDHVAQACQVSKTKLARLHAIRENLHPDLLKLFDRGTLNESAAYELQKLPQGVQDYLSRKKKITENGVAGDAAKICADLCETYLHPKCTCPDGSDCVHLYPRFYETATQRWAYCRGGCCLECHYGESECPYQCRESRKKTEERRAKNRDEKAKTEEKMKIARDENRAKLAGQYMALSVLAKSAGLQNSDVVNIPGAYTVADLERLAVNPSAISDYDARNDQLFTGYTYVSDVRRFAEQVGVSVDFLLGRTKEPAVNTGETDCHVADAPRNDRGETPPTSTSEQIEPHWLTGTPPRVGRYFCRVKGNMDADDEPAKEFRFDWDGETWFFTGRPIMQGMLVLDWWPLPDMEEVGS